MKHHRKTGKLALGRETLRALTHHELSHAAGGATRGCNPPTTSLSDTVCCGAPITENCTIDP
jgi:hypothetical protein